MPKEVERSEEPFWNAPPPAGKLLGMPDLKRTILYTAEFPASCFVVHCRFSSIWSHEVAGAVFPPPPSLTHQATSSTRSALTIDSFDVILKIQVQYVHEAETSLMQINTTSWLQHTCEGWKEAKVTNARACASR